MDLLKDFFKSKMRTLTGNRHVVSRVRSFSALFNQESSRYVSRIRGSQDDILRKLLEQETVLQLLERQLGPIEVIEEEEQNGRDDEQD